MGKLHIIGLGYLKNCSLAIDIYEKVVVWQYQRSEIEQNQVWPETVMWILEPWLLMYLSWYKLFCLNIKFSTQINWFYL